MGRDSYIFASEALTTRGHYKNINLKLQVKQDISASRKEKASEQKKNPSQKVFAKKDLAVP